MRKNLIETIFKRICDIVRQKKLKNIIINNQSIEEDRIILFIK